MSRAAAKGIYPKTTTANTTSTRSPDSRPEKFITSHGQPPAVRTTFQASSNKKSKSISSISYANQFTIRNHHATKNETSADIIPSNSNLQYRTYINLSPI